MEQDETTRDPEYDVGVIHGRFQVLHNDHVRYLLDGKALCRHLIVGITNPDPELMTCDEEADPDRSDPRSNPLTYFERYVMIRMALEEAGLKSSEFSVVPLPINLPRLYKYYVPTEAVFFVTIFDEWGRKKRDTLVSLGLEVRVLREVPVEQKGISGSEVRERMASGGDWEHLVPPAVAFLVKKWDIPGRLQRIHASLTS
ncbi:MAG: nicotinate-nucleotide adenylyltransferase [Promethearchaeota archaeon]